MRKAFLSTLLCAFCCLTTWAQDNKSNENPFAEIGIRASVASFSKNPEFHDRNRTVEIGSVLFDTKTGEVIGLIDESVPGISPDVTSMSIDPNCERYYSISPYAYALNNPVRVVDPDGRDPKDKVVGFGIGLLTNIIPGTGELRDRYSPTDPDDYNNALRNVDNAAIILGSGMIDAGGGGMAMGGAIAVSGLAVTAVSGGTAAIAGLPTAVVGETLVGAGTATASSGAVLMANGNKNRNEGYNRGKSKANEITFIQGKKGHEIKITVKIPEGYRLINERHKSKIFYNGKNYISPDIYGHNGGIWKMGKKIDDLDSKNKRMGTFDENLNRIGD